MVYVLSRLFSATIKKMPPNIHVYDPTLTDPLSKVRGVGRYLQILKENFPDWVFTNNIAMQQFNNESVFINPFFNFLQPPLTFRRVARKQITVIHDLIPLKYPKPFPVGIKGKLNIFLNKLALKNYDLIVTDSEASKRDIMKILGLEEYKIKVIYPCLPKIFTNPNNQIPRYKQISNSNNQNLNQKRFNNLKFENWDLIGNWKLEIGNSFCLYVGDATWNKNLVNLAKAIKIINVTCVFAGNVFNPLTLERVNELTNYNKWQQEFRKFLQETKGDKRFIFLGYVPDDKLVELYQRARCNMLVSRDEGFGFSYLESASQSCPSILSDIQVLHETSKNQGVMFINPADTNDIANALGEVYFNQDLRNRLGIAAKKRTHYFNQKKFVDEFQKILDF